MILHVTTWTPEAALEHWYRNMKRRNCVSLAEMRTVFPTADKVGIEEALCSKVLEGVYRDGKIELTELPGDVQDETRVIVTFLETNPIDLQARGINETQAAELRAQLGTFAEEWDSPEMEPYDNYDAAKAKL